MTVPPRRDTAAWLVLAASAAIAALADGFTTAARMPSFHPPIARALAPSTGLLLTLSAGWLLAAIVVRVVGRLGRDSEFLDALRRPWLSAAALWRGLGTDEEASGRLRDAWGRLTGWAVALSAFAAAAFAAITSFHEPVRTALFLAAVGALLVPIGHGLGRMLGGFLFDRLARHVGIRPSWLGRATIISIGSAVVVAVATALVFSDDVFGDVDPAPWALVLVFGLLATGGSALASRPEGFWPSGIGLATRFGPTRASIAAATSLAVALVTLNLVVPARLPLLDHGALGRVILSGLSRALDMDGDGFPWIVGDDCGPLDPDANPLALEIPGNGRDEDCDGLDTASAAVPLRDPLDGLRAGQGVVRPRGNVLVVILDATRSDHLSLYGYRRETSPALDRFAARAVVFDRFFAVSNHTSLSMPGLLTGRFPSSFEETRVVNWGSFALEPGDRSLQQILGERGYQTVARAGHRMSGFLRGFQEVNERKGRRPIRAEALAASIVDRLRALGPAPPKPVLFLAHFVDAHHPYRAGRAPRRYGAEPEDRYDAEIAYVDEAMKPILEIMASPDYSDWLVVVTSDHGEAFGEHGFPHHGHALYDEEIRVPLVLRVPGVRPGRTSLVAGHLDIVPTVLEWTGTVVPKGLPGRSLLGHVSRDGVDGDSPPRIVLSETFREGARYAARDGRHSLHMNPAVGSWELFDTKTDPVERTNIFRPDRAVELRHALVDHIRRLDKPRMSGSGRADRPTGKRHR